MKPIEDARCEWGVRSHRGPCGKEAVALSRPRDAGLEHPGMPICREHAEASRHGWFEYFEETASEPTP